MTFNNSILSGTVLARENIQSEGYVAGVSGWIIERDGDAEFNSIVVRGDVISVGALYTTRILDGEIIIELNSNPVDNVRMNREGIEFNDAGTGGFTLLDYVDGEGLGFRDNSSTRGPYFDNDSGYWVMADSVPWTPETWKALPLNNGWVNDASNPSAEYRLDADGSLYLRGRIKDGTSVNGTVFATLPAGYRPAVISDMVTTNPAVLTTQNILVNTNGQMQIFNVGAANWIGLSGIGPFKVAGVL